MRSVRKNGDEGGASAVEFALIMIPFVVLVFGMIQYGYYFYVSQTTGGAASTVARRLQVGDCWTSNNALTLAQQQAPNITALTKSPANLTGAIPGTTQIVVSVTADADLLGFVPMPSGGQVTRTVKTQLEDTTEGAPCP